MRIANHYPGRARRSPFRIGGGPMSAAAALAALATLTVAPAAAKTYRATNANTLVSMTDQLVAGDTLAVAPGNYDVETWNLSSMAGTAEKWIHFIAEPGAVIRSTDGCCNLVQIRESSYLHLKGFEITMAKANPGIDGINVSGSYSHHLLFEDLYIHAMTANGISVFSNKADHLELRNSELARMEGSGMYWGYPNRDIVSDIVVEGNYIHHCPVDPNQETDYGFQFKGWGHRARIVNNVFHDVGGTTRSGLIVYYGKKPLAGDDPKDVNVVAGNALWNCRNEGITVMSDAIVENNIVWAAGTGINIQTYNDTSFSGSNYVENLQVRNNTVFRCRSAGVSISGWANAAATVSFTGNAVYQATSGATAISGSLGKGISAGNVAFGQASIAGVTQGLGLADLVAATAANLPPALDLFPAVVSPLKDAVDAQTCPDTDFNGTKRPQGAKCDAGAYEAAGALNPGWKIQEGFKSKGSGVPIRKRKPPQGRRSHAPAADPDARRADGRAPGREPALQALFQRRP